MPLLLLIRNILPINDVNLFNKKVCFFFLINPTLRHSALLSVKEQEKAKKKENIQDGEQYRKGIKKTADNECHCV